MAPLQLLAAGLSENSKPSSDVLTEDLQNKVPQKISTVETAYCIKNIQYKITGMVLERALEEKLQLRAEKKRFSSKKEFESFINNKTRQIKNIRSLKETSHVEYTAEYNKDTQEYEASITANIEAGFNILILPFFSYSSNSGLLLSARGRDYNFLGSLEPLSINIDYKYDETSRNSGGILAGFTYPFAFNNNFFRLSINESINYRDDNTFDNSTQFTVGYFYQVLSFLSFNSSISQSFITATDADISNSPMFSSGSNTVSAGLGIRLNPKLIPVIQNITYSPGVSLTGTYSLTPNDLNPAKRTGLVPSIKQSISFGQINEIGNFRQGLSFFVGNDNSYSFTAGEGWSHSISFETKLHAAFRNIIGIDARMYGVQNFYAFSKPSLERHKGSGAGSYLRGVLDSNFKNARNALAANLTVLLHMFDIQPFVELFAGFFSDFGVRTRADDPANQRFFFDVIQDLKTTFGIEVLAFAIFARSVVLRISYGIDLTKAIEDGTVADCNREIFIGLGRYY